MPVYCYTTKDGQTVERFYPAAKVRKTIRVNGKTAHRDIAAEHGSFKNTPGNWPMKSDACGVSPKQIPEAMETDRRLGVPANYDSKTGQIIWDSPGHRKKWCEAHEYYDRNGGYGDPRRK